MADTTIVKTKSLDRCYICNRNLKDIESLLKLDEASEELARVNAGLSNRIQKVSDDIKTILEKTKDYDKVLLIRELYQSNKAYTKFMPDWELLMKYMPRKIIDAAKSPYEPPIGGNDNKYSIADIRKILSDAVTELDNGKWPKSISEDEEMTELLARKKVFSSLASKQPLETHRHEFRFEVKAEKDEFSKPTVTYVFEFVLCPVCENLLSVYHNTVTADYDD